MQSVPFACPEGKWFSRSAAVEQLGIGKREFYRRVRDGFFPRGRPRIGLKGLWYSPEDMAWMLWYTANQHLFETAVKEKKVG